MANFNTHFKVAIITSGVASTALLSADHVDFNSALWLWFLGTIGGLLPDIDSDNSTSLDTIFALFTFTVIFITLRYLTEALLITRFTKLITASLIAYGIMKYIVRPIFEKISIHRGTCHSLVFLLFCSLLVTQLTWLLTAHYNQSADIIAWLSGGFIFGGGFVHLLLDELYSVDLLNVKIKRSFGSAIKIADFNHKFLTLSLFIGVIGLAYIAPSYQGIMNVLTDWSHFKL